MKDAHHLHQQQSKVTRPAGVSKPATTTKPAAGPTPSANNGIAIGALIVGIIAFLSGWIPFWGLLVGIAALVLGIVALNKRQNKGMAITGIATGGLAALTGLCIIAMTALAISGLSLAWPGLEQAMDDAQSSKQVQEKTKDFAKGETARFGDLDVTVNSVERDFVPKSTLFRAEEGNELVKVNLTVTNVGDKSTNVGPLSFQINNNGLVVSRSYTIVEDRLVSGEVAPGGSVTGSLVFEVDEGAKTLKLQYSDYTYTFGEGAKTTVYTLAL